MIIKILPIQFILLFLSFHLFSQNNQEPCARFVNIVQEKSDQGTVDFTFNIKNNSNRDISSIKIKELGNEGQAMPFKIKPFSESQSTYTISSVELGTTNCYTIDLLDDKGEVFCSQERCLRTESIVYEYSMEEDHKDKIQKADTYLSGTNSYIYLNNTEHQVLLGRDDECCGFEAIITSSGCAPYGYVEIQLIGGTPPYETNGISYIGDPEDYTYEDSELDAGTYTYVFEDSNHCIIEVVHVVPESPTGSAITGGCAPDAWAEVQISGGSGDITGPGENLGGGLFRFDPIKSGSHAYTYEDEEGCTVTVRFTVQDEFVIVSEEVDGCNVIIQVDGGTPDYFEAGDIGQGGGTQTEEGVFEYGPEDFQEDVNQWHTFIFKDQNGCTVQTTLFVPACDKIIESNDGGIKLKNPSENSSSHAVEIFPNPATDDLIINGLVDSENISEIKVLNSSGKILIAQDISTESQIKLDISSIPSGIYFLEIITSDSENKIFKKFVKK